MNASSLTTTISAVALLVGCTTASPHHGTDQRPAHRPDQRRGPRTASPATQPQESGRPNAAALTNGADGAVSASQPQMSDDIEVITACRALVEAYAVHRDRIDSDAFGALFAADAEFVFADNQVEGRAAIIALMQERARGSLTRHLMTTVHIERTGEREAKGLSYFLVYSEPRRKDGTGPLPARSPQAVAEYEDRFVHTEEGWKIQRREVHLSFVFPR